MARLESCGMVPILDDGLVGGNCAIAAEASGVQGASLAAAQPGGSSSSNTGGGRCSVLISRSGKAPGALLSLQDWVLLTRFETATWQADYLSAAKGVRPSSDAPLHAAALGWGAAQRHGWGAQPLVALHGHALAEGAGLERARQHGLPISEEETLFSTPEDLEALELLFRSHPYPGHCCYIRRGHGILLLSQSVAEAAAYLEQHILPLAAAASV